jgi:prepilin-type N-terminal cleavage/methylation domain-containing protein
MKKMRGYFKGRRGFTLIELVVVIVIVGVLASIALPRYASFLERARAAEAIRAIDAIRTGALAYRAETGNFTPYLAGASEIDSAFGVNVYSTNWIYNTSNGGFANGTRMMILARKFPLVSNGGIVYALYGNGVGYWSITSNHPYTPKGAMDPYEDT